jgi:hypothetical protein
MRIFPSLPDPILHCRGWVLKSALATVIPEEGIAHTVEN